MNTQLDKIFESLASTVLETAGFRLWPDGVVVGGGAGLHQAEVIQSIGDCFRQGIFSNPPDSSEFEIFSTIFELRDRGPGREVVTIAAWAIWINWFRRNSLEDSSYTDDILYYVDASARNLPPAARVGWSILFALAVTNRISRPMHILLHFTLSRLADVDTSLRS